MRAAHERHFHTYTQNALCRDARFAASGLFGVRGRPSRNNKNNGVLGAGAKAHAALAADALA